MSNIRLKRCLQESIAPTGTFVIESRRISSIAASHGASIQSESTAQGISDVFSRLSAVGSLVSEDSYQSTPILSSTAIPSSRQDLLSMTSRFEISDKSASIWKANAIKKALASELIRHPSKPLSYVEDESVVIEFHNLENHAVFIMDGDGIQFMWAIRGQPKSEFIPNSAVSFPRLLNRVELISE